VPWKIDQRREEQKEEKERRREEKRREEKRREDLLYTSRIPISGRSKFFQDSLSFCWGR